MEETGNLHFKSSIITAEPTETRIFGGRSFGFEVKTAMAEPLQSIEQ